MGKPNIPLPMPPIPGVDGGDTGTDIPDAPTATPAWMASSDDFIQTMTEKDTGEGSVPSPQDVLPEPPEVEPLPGQPPVQEPPLQATKPVGTPPVQSEPPKYDPGLQQKIDQTQEAINKLVDIQDRMQRAQETPKAPEKTDEELQAEILKQYAFNLPPQMVELLNHEDAGIRGQAMSRVLQYAMAHTHRQVTENYEAKLNQLREGFLQAIPKFVDDSTKQAIQMNAVQQKTRESFYTRHPDLDNPVLHNMVRSVAEEVLKNGAEFNEATMDEIANQTRGILESVRQAQTPQAAPASSPAPTRPQGQAWMSGANRAHGPSKKSNDPNSPDEIWKSLNAGY